MHDHLFADACRPPESVILRLRLAHYSVGHELLLLNQRNPILLGGFEQLPDGEKRIAVIRAVLICCRNWEENKTPHRWLGFWSWLNRRANYALAIADFQNYRMSGSMTPPSPDEEAETIANAGSDNSGGREFGGPWSARLISFLSGITDNPMDFPLGMGLYLYHCHLESEGNLRIENSREAQVKEEMAGHRRALAERKAKEVSCPA